MYVHQLCKYVIIYEEERSHSSFWAFSEISLKPRKEKKNENGNGKKKNSTSKAIWETDDDDYLEKPYDGVKGWKENFSSLANRKIYVIIFEKLSRYCMFTAIELSITITFPWGTSDNVLVEKFHAHIENLRFDKVFNHC